jgi:hypothetical protein
MKLRRARRVKHSAFDVRRSLFDVFQQCLFDVSMRFEFGTPKFLPNLPADLFTDHIFGVNGL